MEICPKCGKSLNLRPFFPKMGFMGNTVESVALWVFERMYPMGSESAGPLSNYEGEENEYVEV